LLPQPAENARSITKAAMTMHRRITSPYLPCISLQRPKSKLL
jgi:hypothetical protein